MFISCVTLLTIMKNTQPEAFTSVICNLSLIFLVLQQSLFPLVYAIILGSPSYQRQVLNERCIAPLTFTALRSWRGPERCLRFCNPFVNSAYFYTSGFLVVKYLAWFLYDTVDHPGCLSFRYDCDNPNKNNNIFHLAIKCKTNPWIKKIKGGCIIRMTLAVAWGNINFAISSFSPYLVERPASSNLRN